METRIPKGKDKKSRRKDCKDPFAAGASLVRILVCEIRDDGEDLPGAGAGGGTLRKGKFMVSGSKKEPEICSGFTKKYAGRPETELFLDFPYGMYYNFY